MPEDRKPEPGDWICLPEMSIDVEGGEVIEVQDGAVKYWDHGKERSFTVPISQVTVVEHPAIIQAAREILDILREFDPRWGQQDTWSMRQRIVRRVMTSVRPDHPGLKRPGVSGD